LAYTESFHDPRGTKPSVDIQIARSAIYFTGDRLSIWGEWHQSSPRVTNFMVLNLREEGLDAFLVRL